MWKVVFNQIIRRYLKHRYKRIEKIRTDPIGLQEQVLSKILKYNKSLIGNNNPNQWFLCKPVVEYNDIEASVNEMMLGQKDVLCSGVVSQYAKSSGTTGNKSKYLPLNRKMRYGNHVSCSWDTMAIIYNDDPSAKIFRHKSIVMGGSLETKGSVTIGDVSALLLGQMPWPGRPFYTPSMETALLSDWEEKIEKMARTCPNEQVVMAGGVPTWTLVLFNKILETQGKKNMHEVWPMFKYYMHGGVGFEPYKEEFSNLFPQGISYYEAYNASEGFFAIQDGKDKNGMLLLLDHYIYYEFIPLDKYPDQNKLTPLKEVIINTPYVMVITTVSGLWRYVPGDVVEFLSTKPYRVKVCGRTKQYINAFGEELMAGNVEMALKEVLSKHDARINEYTIAPVYIKGANQGYHQWLVEFQKLPKDIALFEKDLDNALRNLNSDYDAKRYKDIALQGLKINIAKNGLFHTWLKKKGKYGGQHKVPRLSNTREYMDELIAENK